MKHLITGIILLLPVIGLPQIRYMASENYTSEFLDYAINAGYVLPQFVLRQPYERVDTLLGSKGSASQFHRDYQAGYFKQDQAVLFFNLHDQLRQNSLTLNRFRADGGGRYTAPHITLVNRISVDQDYRDDSRFAGDLSESGHWLYGRINEAYIALNAGKFDVFFGRTHRNWGAPATKGLILSDNPYTYDHLLVNYTTNHFKLSLIFAQLENMDTNEFNPADSSLTPVKDAHKYLTGHRLDIRLLPSLQVGLSEMAIYGGTNRPVEWSFMNPVNLYYPIQRNDRKQISGLWALDVFYKPVPRLTFYGQLLIDDVIVNNDPGVDDRARYPDRLGVMISMRSADWPFSSINNSFTYTKIWNRTYQSIRGYENYHYRGYGLGFPCASCEEIHWRLSVWKWFPFWIRNEFIYGQYGNVDITDVFRLQKEAFPVEPVTVNFINQLEMHYHIRSWLNFEAALIYRKEPLHYSNRFRDESRFVAKIGLNLLLQQSLRVD
jgi:hypothetical protein